MKHLKKYHNYLINESKSETEYRDELTSNLIDILSDLIDDGYLMYLNTGEAYIKVNDIINNNEESLNRLKPVYKAGNKIISTFDLIIKPNGDYEDFLKIINEMSSVIGRLSDMGWFMKKFYTGQDSDSLSEKNKTPGKFISISYNFTRPTIKVEGKITEDQIRKEFDNIGLNVEDIRIGDNTIELGAESKSYDGKIPNDIVGYLDRVKNRLGIDYYEHSVSGGNWLYVKFWIDDPDIED